MKRFLVRLSTFLLLFLSLSLGYTGVRIWLSAEDVERSMRFAPTQKVLFMGDSHVGCTFIEGERYENCVLWESSMPQQFTLMRLREMEKRGALKNIELLVLDIGQQSIGQQRKERMKELWWRMIPLSIRHYDLLPLSLWDRLEQYAKNPNGLIRIRHAAPDADVSVLTRTPEERESNLRQIAAKHFNWINAPDEMCQGWERSLKSALDEICELCARNQVPLVFISAPLTSYYVNAIPRKAKEKLAELTDLIQDRRVPYYDLREWGEDDLFRDCFHFRLKGARKFTEWFYEEIVPRHRKPKAHPPQA